MTNNQITTLYNSHKKWIKEIFDSNGKTEEDARNIAGSLIISVKIYTQKQKDLFLSFYRMQMTFLQNRERCKLNLFFYKSIC